MNNLFDEKIYILSYNVPFLRHVKSNPKQYTLYFNMSFKCITFVIYYNEVGQGDTFDA